MTQLNPIILILLFLVVRASYPQELYKLNAQQLTTCVTCIAAPPTACAVAAIAPKYRFLPLRFNIFKFHTKQKSVIHHKYQLNNVVINQLSINTGILIFLPSLFPTLITKFNNHKGAECGIKSMFTQENRSIYLLENQF